jgi:hypothetical protein
MRQTESRPEERYHVDFQVFLSWQDRTGDVHRVSGRCLDLSPSGLRIETRDAFETGQSVLVQCEQFGRMGNASVRYCRRGPMKYSVGLQFGTVFGLGDPVRTRILEKVLSKANDKPPA